MPMYRIELCGLDGSNLLAYMAALGTLRVLSRNHEDVRLSWTGEHGFWMPVADHPALDSQDAVIAELTNRLAEPNRALAIGDDLSFTSDEFQRFAEDSIAPADRRYSDFICAFASDACTDRTGVIETTALRAIGGGQQRFLAFMQKLAEITDAGHLRKALFSAWDYSDDKPSMRWDPNDFRPHALQAIDPSNSQKNPIKTMRGANRLAIEALPFFATMPQARGLDTTGFRGSGARKIITWPIWTEALNADIVGSVLSLAELQHDTPDRAALEARGIPQAFRAYRFTEGQYRNFSPAHELM